MWMLGHLKTSVHSNGDFWELKAFRFCRHFELIIVNKYSIYRNTDRITSRINSKSKIWEDKSGAKAG